MIFGTSGSGSAKADQTQISVIGPEAADRVSVQKRFLADRHGNFALVSALMMVTMAIGVGVAVDYSSGVSEREHMRDALDAALLATTTLPKDATLAERGAALQASYGANGGMGSANLDSFTIDSVGRATANGSASYDDPTTFMGLAGFNQTRLGVRSALEKEPSLVSAKFETKIASGYWNKTITLWGRKNGSTLYNQLMVVTYVYNGQGQGKGYGTTVMSTVDPNGSSNEVQRQVCTSATSCTTTNSPGVTGAEVDLSSMNDIYLEMRGGSPNVMKSNDPATSNRLYIDGVETPAGQVVDIVTAVPCNMRGEQAWEDGGNAVPAPVSNADFVYYITGRCDYSARAGVTTLTQ